ncbi:MAG: hypothetical protein WA459_10580 [Stellaceae bacterium]
MARAHFTRILVIVGWAVGLVILPAALSGIAKACLISAKSAVAVGATIDGCTVGGADEEKIADYDQTVMANDDLASSQPSSIVWSPENYLQIVSSGRDRSRGPSAGADLLDLVAAEMAAEAGAGGASVQHSLSGLRVALGGSHIGPGNDRGGPSDDVLWEIAKYLVKHYDLISPDGDLAAIIRLGAEAVHSLDQYSSISLDGDAAATGLGPGNRYQPIGLYGNGADTGLQPGAPWRAASGGSFHEVGGLASYLVAVHNFVFSRDGVITALIIMVGFVAIAGLQSLTRGLR